MTGFKCSNKDCGKIFLLPAKIVTERKSKDFYSETLRTVVEKPCCPFCEGLEFTEVS